MKEWQIEYKKKFGLCSEKSDKCDCYRELKFISKLLDQVRLETIREVEERINQVKEAVSKNTGSYKYDSCYDDCLDVCNQLKLYVSKI